MEPAQKRIKLSPSHQNESETFSTRPGLNDLPNELLLKIFKHLNWRQRNHLALQCRRFYNLCRIRELLPRVNIDLKRVITCKLDFLCGYFPITQVIVNDRFLDRVSLLSKQHLKILTSRRLKFIDTISFSCLTRQIMFVIEHLLRHFPAVNHLQLIYILDEQADTLNQLINHMNQITKITFNGLNFTSIKNFLMFANNLKEIIGLYDIGLHHLIGISALDLDKPLTIKLKRIDLNTRISYDLLLAKNHKLIIDTITLDTIAYYHLYKNQMEFLSQCLASETTLEVQGKLQQVGQDIDSQALLPLLPKLKKLSIDITHNFSTACQDFSRKRGNYDGFEAA